MIVLAFLLLVPVLVDVVRRPTFRNLALRSIGRRRGEAALVIVGSLLGTAIITASFVVGDTVEASIRDAARTSLGPIDEAVRLVGPAPGAHAAPEGQPTPEGQAAPVRQGAPEGQAVSAARVTAAVTAPPIAGVDGVLPIRSAGVVAADVSPDRKAEPTAAMIEVDFDEARRFGPDPRIGGLADAGPTPAGDEVVVSTRLAADLDVHVGDPVELFAYGGSRQFRVREVVPEVGLAGYSPVRSSRFTGRRPSTVFVPRGTIDSFFAQAASTPAGAQAQPPADEVLVSNTGGVFDGVDRSDAVAAELRARTAGLPGAQVSTVKADVLDQAKAQGSSLSQLFRSIGYFSVIAGILLLVNLFVMLSEERKSELGTLRALGFKRNHLVRTFAIEGATYSVVAAVLGSVVGVGVGWGVVQATAGIFNRGNADLAFRLSVKPASLVAGAGLGLVICLVTVWATSARIARLNIIRSIRDLPEPRLDRRSRRSLVTGSVVTALGAAAFVVGWKGDTAGLVLAGPALCCFGLIPVLGRFLPRKAVTVALSLAALAWGIAVFSVAPGKVGGAGIDVFVVQGVVLVTAGVVVLAQADRAWAALARAVAASGSGLAARLGLAYPLARKFRTALLLGMYSIVIFTMAFISVVAGVIGDQAPTIAGQVRSGFDLFVDSSQSNPVTVEQLASRPQVAAVAPLTRGTAQAVSSTSPDGAFVAVTGFDQSLVAEGQPQLGRRGAAYASDADAYRAVLADPGLVIVTEGFGSRNQGAGPPPAASLSPGDTVTLKNPSTGATRQLTVAGIMNADLVGNGAMLSNAAVDDLLGARKVVNRHYVKVKGGADADAAASSITGAFIQNGASAHTFRGVVDDQLQAQIGFFGLLRAYLGLGLLIGIAGLGVVMVRAVRERRREIGMLRAVGFSTLLVRRAFILEAAFITLQGILLGIVLGVVTSYSLLVNSEVFGSQKLDITWPWPVLVAIAVVPLVASLLATAWPATQAARIRPAAALRIAD